MLITVIMCTRNRAKQLGNVLDTFVHLAQPVGATWEMLIVDNGSTDDTAAVIERYSARLPLRRVSEPAAGLSNARNAGVRAAQGDYICWTDDDVEVDPDWLAAYTRAFHRHPDGTIFGGVVEPVYEVPPPAWLADEPLLAGMLAQRDLGPDEKCIPPQLDALPFGANFAVRAKEQRQCQYDPALGVSPFQKRLAEETCVLAEIGSMGGGRYWVPDSRVRHIIPAHRLTFDYVKKYFQSVGETWAYLSVIGGPEVMGQAIAPGGRRLGGVPLWIWRISIQSHLRYRLRRVLKSQPKYWLEDLITMSRFVGARRFFIHNASGK